jgi:hypothetical protein
MTKPTAASIEEATNLTGLQRQYIKAVAEEAATKATAALRVELVTLISMSTKYNDTDLNNRLSRLEGRYVEDDKFALTRPKLMALMQEMGWE